MKTLEEKIKIGTGSLLAVVGLVDGFSKLIDAFDKVTQKVHFPLSVAGGLLFCLALIAIGLLFIIDGLTRRSRLVRPEMLLIERDNPEDLKGREEDIKDLSTLCREYRELHLVGESGVGKSALLQTGLARSLKETKWLFPVYVDVWGNDWEQGPKASLVDALWHALPEERSTSLGLKPGASFDLTIQSLGKFKTIFGQKPLLIFDQFDNYVIRHWKKLFHMSRRRWLTASELSAKNDFWKAIESLLNREAIHILFATTTTEADALTIVRFGDAKVFRLSRLAPEFVRPIIDELTNSSDETSPAILDPDRGWTRLKDRLINDLSRNSLVLPIRVKVIVQGLAGLPRLTVHNYSQLGGLRGLEGAFVERRIESAARDAALSLVQVRRLLCSLVSNTPNQSDQSAYVPSLTTVPQTIESLVIIVCGEEETEGAKGKFSDKIQVCLSTLERLAIVRAHRDPESDQKVWSLYHDYFCAGVLEAERRANRWNTFLKEKHLAYLEEESYYLRKWRLLLSPTDQAALIYNRFRGRVKYAQYRSYTLLSFVRLLPYIVMPLLILIAADAGASIPGGAFLRALIDRYEVSVFRPIYKDNIVQQSASDLRKRISEELKSRRGSNGWISVVPGRADLQPISHAQSLSALLRAPEVSQEDRALYQESIKVLFAPGMTIDRNGVSYGWLNSQKENYAHCESLLWVISALALSHTKSITRQGTTFPEWDSYFSYVQKAAKIYQPDASGGWNTFPNQQKLGEHGIYTSALALLAMLELRSAGLDWSTSDTYLDDSIRKTANWLISQYDRSGRLHGWHPGKDDVVSDGLTLQIFSELLRAESEVQLAIPENILIDAPALLETLIGRQADYPPSMHTFFDIQFTNYDGQVISTRLFFNYLWYPWGIECATQWRNHAQHSASGRPEDVILSKRVLSHLIVDLGEKEFENANANFSFVGAEMLYVLSSVNPKTN